MGSRLGLFLLGLSFVYAASLTGRSPKQRQQMPKSDHAFENIFNTFVQDMADVNRAVFTSTDTLKILTWVVPVYLIARFSDDRIHSAFYDSAGHRNISQLPEAFATFTSKTITVLAISLLFSPFFSFVDPEIRRVSLLMAEGLFSIFIIRTLAKYSIKGRSCLRPWNGNFSAHQRSFGGFPSGHMAMAGYLTTLYAMQFGPKWGVPLGILTALASFASINRNRHYASQIVSGIGLGAIYGYAANKVLDTRLNDRIEISMDMDAKFRPNFSLSYNF